MLRSLQFCIAALFLAPHARAEEGAKLQEIRAIYEREAGKVRIAALQAHAAKLTALVESLEKAAEAGAASSVRAYLAATQKEIAQLSGLSPVEEPGPPKPPEEITLKIEDAELAGSLRLGSGYIRLWNSTTCSARWTKRDLRPGRYEVHLEYRPVYGGGGAIEVRDIRQVAQIAVPPASFSNFGSRTVLAGRFDFGESIGLQVNARSRSQRGIFLLTGVKLVPIPEGK